MAKKAQDWDRAKALYQIGKTTREIESTTGIPIATIHRHAKKEGWIHGEVKQTISNGAQFVADLEQQNGTLKQESLKEIERISKAKGYIENVSLLAIKQISKLMPVATDMKDVKAGVEALNVAMKTTGIVPYYPTMAKAADDGESNKSIQLEIIGVKSSNSNT